MGTLPHWLGAPSVSAKIGSCPLKIESERSQEKVGEGKLPVVQLSSLPLQKCTALNTEHATGRLDEYKEHTVNVSDLVCVDVQHSPELVFVCALVCCEPESPTEHLNVNTNLSHTHS